MQLLNEAGFLQIYFARAITRFLIPDNFFTDFTVVRPSTVETHDFPNFQVGMIRFKEGPGFLDILCHKNKYMIMLKCGRVDAGEIPVEDQTLILIRANGKDRPDSSGA